MCLVLRLISTSKNSSYEYGAVGSNGAVGSDGATTRSVALVTILLGAAFS